MRAVDWTSYHNDPLDHNFSVTASAPCHTTPHYFSSSTPPIIIFLHHFHLNYAPTSVETIYVTLGDDHYIIILYSNSDRRWHHTEHRDRVATATAAKNGIHLNSQSRLLWPAFFVTTTAFPSDQSLLHLFSSQCDYSLVIHVRADNDHDTVQTHAYIFTHTKLRRIRSLWMRQRKTPRAFNPDVLGDTHTHALTSIQTLIVFGNVWVWLRSSVHKVLVNRWNGSHEKLKLVAPVGNTPLVCDCVLANKKWHTDK